jgi:S1-C subfamily serine protease
MNEPTVSRSQVWKMSLKRIGAGALRVLPFFITVLVTLGALALYNHFFSGPPPLNSADVNKIANSVLASATPRPANGAGVYQVIMPSLVLIETQLPPKDGKDVSGVGTGVIINDSGAILTALHVVQGATFIKLTFSDGTVSNGTIASTTPDNDMALLSADTLPATVVPATIGNPNAMRVGDEVYAVGNPLGLYASLTAGVISGFNRTFQSPQDNQPMQGLIQIDTAVNPGNSGGPLLNRYGQVVGIIEGIVNPTGQDVFIGIGFAVPITSAGGGFSSPPD